MTPEDRTRLEDLAEPCDHCSTMGRWEDGLCPSCERAWSRCSACGREGCLIHDDGDDDA